MERYRTTIILVVVLAVLAGLAFFLNNKGTAGSTDALSTPTPNPAKAVWTETSPVDSIDVISGTNRVSLRKDLTSTIWSLIAPIQAEADPYSVAGQADALQSLQALTVITSASNLADFGLDKPAWQVMVRSSGAKPTKHTLYIGATTIDGAGYYVKQPDIPTVYVVANTTIEPMKGWLTTPPKAQPTPTPVPLTVVPPSTVTATQTLTVTLPISSTGTVTTNSPITSTGPGAANPTTPVASPTTGK